MRIIKGRILEIAYGTLRELEILRKKLKKHSEELKKRKEINMKEIEKMNKRLLELETKLELEREYERELDNL